MIQQSKEPQPQPYRVSLCGFIWRTELSANSMKHLVSLISVVIKSESVFTEED